MHNCALPPHILTNLALNGDRRQREQALQTLAVDQSLRTVRVGSVPPTGDAAARGAGQAAACGPGPLTIFDAQNSHHLPGQEVRGSHDPPTGDSAVDNAWRHLTDTLAFFGDAFGRPSLDSDGGAIDATVHYGSSYDNAFWDGRRLVFGDGDGHLFGGMTTCVDLVAHELTHGVIENEAQLIYWAQSGALNESLSDVFGSMVKQYVRDEKVEQADWLIGEGLLLPMAQGVALRSLKAPGTAYDDPVLGKDPQPGDTEHYVRDIADNGSMHINSGIPNRAFFLAATNIGGFSWEGAGLIWYASLTSPFLRRSAQFHTFASITVTQAEILFPGSDIRDAVIDAWAQVGVLI